ncbi:hypothetical protein OB919_18800 [Halobacteria archaeon AArc-curdl1]|uniref:Uncharacterized protein n=1 Tax=Natronosalvus hydrolyticus TaxID=2979988 RepID=A0AAP3E8L2_9EURY|nr:hypothetical protein [Halobacteria archaeon AArc-curdl1]
MDLTSIGQQTASNWCSDPDNSDDDSDNYDVRSDGTIVVNLGDDDVERAHTLARERNRSYLSGATTDDNWSEGKSGGDIHVQGLLAEIAMEIVYGVPVDESISAVGDGGIDGELETIDGETLAYDIKSREYDGPGAALLAKKDNVDIREEHPDVYIASYVDVDNRTVHIDGWLHYDEFVDESNIAEAKADWLDHINYEAPIGQLNEPWVPDN